MADPLGILWIVWIIICILVILVAIKGARRAIRARNTPPNNSYGQYGPTESYPPSYVVRTNSTSLQPNPLSSMYYGAPYPPPPREYTPSTSAALHKPDSVVDIPPPSYQDHSKDMRLPKPV
ncbi:hypothetical protein Unana1_03728 [Umbelopsis nana]